MPKCLLNKCCCCVNLRLGCFIIGYFCLIIGVFGLVFMGLTYSTVEREGKLILLGEVAIILFNVATIILNIMLLVGLHKNKPQYVRNVFTAYYWILPMSAFAFIVQIASGKRNAFSIIEKGVNLLILVYFTLVIRSYYHKMLAGAPPSNP